LSAVGDAIVRRGGRASQERAYAQPRGFTNSVAGPITDSRQGSQVRRLNLPADVPETASAQVGGFTKSPRGVHKRRITSIALRAPSPSVRTIARHTDRRRTAAGNAMSAAERCAFVLTQLGEDIRPGHSVRCRHASTQLSGSTEVFVASRRRGIVGDYRRTESPEGSLSNCPSLGLHSFAGLRKSGSKIDVQYYWTWRPRRRPMPWACPRDGLGFAALGEKA
jgi:uncharacterized Fe-S cluster protein YjdI